MVVGFLMYWAWLSCSDYLTSSSFSASRFVYPPVCLYLPNHSCSSIFCWFLDVSNCSDNIASWLAILWPVFHSVSLTVYLVAHICALVCQVCLFSIPNYQVFYLQGLCWDGVAYLVAFFMHRRGCVFTVYSLSYHLLFILSACLHISWSSLFLNIVLTGLDLLSASCYIHI